MLAEGVKNKVLNLGLFTCIAIFDKTSSNPWTDVGSLQAPLYHTVFRRFPRSTAGLLECASWLSYMQPETAPCFAKPRFPFLLA